MMKVRSALLTGLLALITPTAALAQAQGAPIGPTITVQGDCTGAGVSPFFLKCSSIQGAAPGTAFSYNVGTTNGTIGVLGQAKTEAGAITFTGANTHSGSETFASITSNGITYASLPQAATAATTATNGQFSAAFSKAFKAASIVVTAFAVGGSTAPQVTSCSIDSISTPTTAPVTVAGHCSVTKNVGALGDAPVQSLASGVTVMVKGQDTTQ